MADHVVDVNWLGRMVVDKGQCGCDLRIVDGDHVGGTPGDDVQRFGDQSSRLAQPAAHHAVQQGSGAVTCSLGIQGYAGQRWSRQSHSLIK